VNPREATDAEVAYWDDRDTAGHEHLVIGGPEEAPDVIPCHAIAGYGCPAVHVAYELNEIEVAHLATGGTLWLSTWGGLPIHRVEVVSRDDVSRGFRDRETSDLGALQPATSETANGER
jgi:hypothetical protein